MLEQFGKYEILGELGAGGMAVVFKARDTLLKRIVALKVINHKLQGGEHARKRFLNEGRAAAALSHQNIVGIYELGIEDGQPFIAMECLSGSDLRELLDERRPLELQQKLDIALQVARALEHAHARGVIHRDIKPGNIRVLEGGQVRLMDFGIAKITSEEVSRLTRTGGVLGTVAYMSPEQLRGETPAEAADVFAFGVVLYELLTGRKPFDGPHSPAVMHQILYTEPPPIDGDEASPALARLVYDCLRKSVRERIGGFARIVEVLSELRRELFGPEAAARRPMPSAATDALLARELTGASAESDDQTTQTEQLGASAEPRRRRAVATAVLVPGLLLALGALLFAPARLNRQEDRPREESVTAPQQAPTPPPAAAPQATDPGGPLPLLAVPPSETPATAVEPSPRPATPVPEQPAGLAPATPTRPRTPSRTPARTPSLPPSPSPASPLGPPAVPRPPSPAAPGVRELRVRAPEGTQICLDGQVADAPRAGVAWTLTGVAPGRHVLRLIHPKKGTAEASIEVQPGSEVQRVIFEDADWKAPGFRVTLPSADGGGLPFEGQVGKPYRVDLGSGRMVGLTLQWSGALSDSAELSVEDSDGMLSTVRCVRGASAQGCQGPPWFECGTVR